MASFGNFLNSGGDVPQPTDATAVAGVIAHELMMGVEDPVMARMVPVARAPLGLVPSGVMAVLTDLGRDNNERIPVDGLRFGTRLEDWTFRIGRSGYDPDNIHQATVPDPEALDIVDPVSEDYSPVDRVERTSDTSIAFLCRLERDEFVDTLGEIGIYATITDSPDAEEIDTRFLYAIAHFPAYFKLANETRAIRIPLQS